MPLKEIFFCLLLLCLTARAEPMNVLVGDLTFTRPEKWRYEALDDNSAVLARFVVRDTSGGQPPTDVRFYLTTNDASSAASVWRTYFPKLISADIEEERKKIGRCQITYVTLRGLYRPKAKDRPDHIFLGAVIPSAGRFVHARLLGPRFDVEHATAEFKRMIEEAVKDRGVE